MSAVEENEASLGKVTMDNAITVVRNLEAAGMPSEQADCVVNSMQALINTSHETIAADLDKRDLADKAATRNIIGEEIDKRDLVDKAATRNIIGEEIDKRDLVDKKTFRVLFSEEIDRRDLVSKADLDERDLVSKETLRAELGEISVQIAELHAAMEKSIRVAMMQTVVMVTAIMAVFFGIMQFFS
ncbi:MAG: hypothetical protein ACR2PJ_02190 [Pseudomonadales bacterium]